MLPAQIRELGKKNGLALPYDLKPGQALLRYPNNKGYVAASEAEEVFVRDVVDCIFHVAQRLGARRIVYCDCQTSNQKRELSTENGLSVKAVKVDANVDKSTEEKLSKIFTRTTEYVPNPDLSAEDRYSNALSFARDNGLMGYAEIRELLNARNPQSGSLAKSHKIKADLTSSLNKSLNVAVTLNVLPVFHLDSTTKTATETCTTVNVSWDVEF
ncbi:MAG: hypothetical protein PUJ24_04945 [Bacteroidales bacterium]|nr:hypothetical protein [Bacteroidales bacterium]